MKAFIWKLRAYLYMHRRAGWASWGMVAALYETYAEDWEMSPAEAVDEDMSYWGD
jgi:hypothetical protein